VIVEALSATWAQLDDIFSHFSTTSDGNIHAGYTDTAKTPVKSFAFCSHSLACASAAVDAYLHHQYRDA